MRRTPVVMDWNVSRDARELERAAVREMIEAGHHREALFQLLLVRTAAQGIIENDGDEEARASSRIGYRQLLAALGIDGDEPFHARGQALGAVTRAVYTRSRGGPEVVMVGKLPEPEPGPSEVPVVVWAGRLATAGAGDQQYIL